MMLHRLLSLYQTLRYGTAVPGPDQVLWLRPQDLTLRLRTAMPRGTWFQSKKLICGTILPGSWWQDVVPVEESRKLAYCTAHWRDGLDWEGAGAYVKLRREVAAGRTRDDCATEADIKARFARLDTIYDEAARRGRLLSHVELAAQLGVPVGDVIGILVHIGPDGTPIFGRSGNHRLAIARLQRHDWMPCRIGVVHPDAIRLLPALLRAPEPVSAAS